MVCIMVWIDVKCNKIMVLAERQGFEPWIQFPVYTLSKRAPSATRPSLRLGITRRASLILAAADALEAAASRNPPQSSLERRDVCLLPTRLLSTAGPGNSGSPSP